MRERPHAALLIALLLLPLLLIALQLGCGLAQRFGMAGYALYKIAFLLPPLIYCRRRRIGLLGEIAGLQNWQRSLPAALGLSLLAFLLFWGCYLGLGDRLLDEPRITAKLAEQFRVTSRSVLLVAPLTILLNSLLEEFFYRGFIFGQLGRRLRRSAYLLTAAVFTLQHYLFIREWLDPLPLGLAVIALFLLALILARLYERTRSLVAPWIVHMGGDLAMMTVAISLLRA